MIDTDAILKLLKEPGSLFVNAGGCSGVANLIKSLVDEIIRLRKEASR